MKYSVTGCPCNLQGNYLPDRALPPPWDHLAPDDWCPYDNCPCFKLANLLYCHNQMLGSHISDLMQIWATTLSNDHNPPFASKEDLYNTLTLLKLAIHHGSRSQYLIMVNWMTEMLHPGRLLHMMYGTGILKMSSKVSYQILILLFHTKGNSGCEDQSPSVPKFYVRMLVLAYSHALVSFHLKICLLMILQDQIAENEHNHGAILCPIILGSDKTTVSVATGHNEYYPLYMSKDLIHNDVHQAH